MSTPLSAPDDKPNDKTPVPYSDPVSDEEYRRLAKAREELGNAARKADEGERATLRGLPGRPDSGTAWMRYAGLVESGDSCSSQHIDDVVYGQKD